MKEPFDPPIFTAGAAGERCRDVNIFYTFLWLKQNGLMLDNIKVRIGKVFSEIDAKDKSFSKNGIGMLQRPWNDGVVLRNINFERNSRVSIVNSGTSAPMCYSYQQC